MKKINPVLSIVIVNFNTYQYLEKCLKSIFQSDNLKISPEIIIVDNNSSDRSVQLLRKNFPELIIIANHRNVGFAKANNQGISKSRGEYILLLNPDTLLHGEVLKRTVSFMDSNTNAGVSTCMVNLLDGRIDDACHRGFPTPWNSFCHFSGLGNLFRSSTFFNGYHLGYKDLDKTHEIDSCTGAFMLVRRTAGDSVNWLDEDYFWYGEDLDFCYKIKEKGWLTYFIADVGIVHYKGVSSGIKKHSEKISTSSKETRLMVNKARFGVMKIFYTKHYKNKYPKILMDFIFAIISLKENINKVIYKFNG